MNYISFIAGLEERHNMKHEDFEELQTSFNLACEQLTRLEEQLVPFTEQFTGLFPNKLKSMSSGEKLKAASSILEFYNQIKSIE